MVRLARWCVCVCVHVWLLGLGGRGHVTACAGLFVYGRRGRVAPGDEAFLFAWRALGTHKRRGQPVGGGACRLRL